MMHKNKRTNKSNKRGFFWAVTRRVLEMEETRDEGEDEETEEEETEEEETEEEKTEEGGTRTRTRWWSGRTRMRTSWWRVTSV
jgi:hypothetical protein